MHEKTINRRYHKELFGALGIYAVLLVGAISYGRGMPDGVLRTLVLASPMIGFGLAAWAIARHIRRIDEYLRQFTLENLGIAAAATAGISFTYGFMETAGYPRQSGFVVWCLMGAVWMLVTLVRMVRDR